MVKNLPGSRLWNEVIIKSLNSTRQTTINTQRFFPFLRLLLLLCCGWSAKEFVKFRFCMFNLFFVVVVVVETILLI